MLKHGHIYPRKKRWTMRYLRWHQKQRFDHPAQSDRTPGDGRGGARSNERVERLARVIEEFVRPGPGADRVGASDVAWGRPDRRRDVRHRSGRCQPVRKPTPVHGSRSRRALNRGDSPARRRHKGRQQSCSPHVGRERLDRIGIPVRSMVAASLSEPVAQLPSRTRSQQDPKQRR